MTLRHLLLVLTFAAPLRAQVTRIDVSSRTDIVGKSFGSAGEYERLTGRMYFAIDPRNSANRIITDIDKAPKNTAGLVEFSANFYLLKPKDVRRGNGTVLFEVSNRGGRAMVPFFNRDARNVDPPTAEHMGDGFLMEQGFTLLWVGWQFDVPQRGDPLRVDVPIAREADGRRITGLVRSDSPLSGALLPLADRGHVPYAIADAKDPANVLTVRDCIECPRRVVPREQWEFTDDGVNVRLLTTPTTPWSIYEVVYKSIDPPVVGLGPAAVRDAISKLKFDAVPELSIPQGALSRAIAFGISQSGRFLRTFIYYGFNEDASHRKVFDGIMAHVAGGGRGSFNHRFAQPSRDAHPFLNFFHPADIFPFTDAEQVEPATGVRDGIMTHAGKPQFLPKVFYTNASYEYWGRAAALIHTSIDGRQDAEMMPNVRVYLMSAGQHGPAGTPSATGSEQLTNPLDYRWGMRKLLVDMNRWVTDGTEPPASAYPRVTDKTLVAPEALAFPSIPGVNGPATPHKAYRADYGPDFARLGLVTREPPAIGGALPMRVPQVDADGNDIAGVRMPELMVPLATYTGWNRPNAETGPPNTNSNVIGSFIPFPRTRADRERTKDPRRSIEERYQGRDHYLSLVTQAASALAAKGYVRTEDVPRIVEQAGTRWDFIANRR